MSCAGGHGADRRIVNVRVYINHASIDSKARVYFESKLSIDSIYVALPAFREKSMGDGMLRPETTYPARRLTGSNFPTNGTAHEKLSIDECNAPNSSASWC
jgi:hypothetical protein